MSNARNQIIREIELRLGGQMVDVELDPEHYHLAIDKAYERYRQRSSNAHMTDYIPLDIKAEQDTYILDNDIDDVVVIYSRMFGTSTQSTGEDFQPFEAQFMNNVFRNSSSGDLATFDALMQRQELVGEMTGANYMFDFFRTRHLLRIHRKPKADYTVYLQVERRLSEDEIFEDLFAKPWIKEYALAQSKLMLAEARGKFSSIVGPGGGVTLNAGELKADAKESLEKLETEIKNFVDGTQPPLFLIG